MADEPKISSHAPSPEIVGSKVISGSMRPMMTQTQTEAVNFHQIEDNELDKLINISSPVSLGVCTMTAGGFIGLLPTITPSMIKVYKDGAISIIDLFYIIVATVCLIMTIIYGLKSSKELISSKHAVDDIRKRPKKIID